MSQPISPAIIINENFDAQQELPTGYNVLVTGFTSAGIANEPFIISNITDFVSLFGEPDGSHPEQIYAYDAVERVINSGSNAVFTKIPYGAEGGYDVGEEYSALVFPAVVDNTEDTTIVSYTVEEEVPLSSFENALSASGLHTQTPYYDGLQVGDEILKKDYDTVMSAFTASSLTLSASANEVISNTEGYAFGEPYKVSLTEEEYDNIECGQIDWSDSLVFDSDLSSYDPVEFGKAGLIVLDNYRSKSTDSNEGYYISVTDNTDADPASDYDAITAIKTTTNESDEFNVWKDLPSEKYDFKLTSPYTSNTASVSQSVTALATQGVPSPWEDGKYKNFLNVSLWRIRKDIRNGSNQLVSTIVENHTGSIDATETEITEGGFETNVFIGDVVEGKSSRLKVLVNPNISNDDGYTNNKGEKVKSVRMWREATRDEINDGADIFNGYADALYSVSQYTPKQTVAGHDIGNLPLKLQAALCSVDNPDRVDLDLSLEAGLGTIWTTVKSDPDAWLAGTPAINSFNYDDGVYLDIEGDLGRSIPENTEEGKFRDLWSEINDKFLDFTENVRISNGGYHHLHIADTLRQILVNGVDCKVFSAKTKCKDSGIFAKKIYHPSKNLTRLLNTSLVTVDAQWYKTNNNYTSKGTWVPSSGVVAGLFGSTNLPWDAAAGVSNGRVSGVTDIAIDPVQRDRDLLWKIHHNAVFYDRSTNGFLRFADQTQLKNDNIQLKQNSARRLLVWLEKNLRIALRPFLFEPNNFQTRVRFKNEIELYLKTLLDNGAIEDFAVSLSKNTAALQQEGTLVADIAIKITGVVDRVVLNFNLLRLDQPFQEIF